MTAASHKRARVSRPHEPRRTRCRGRVRAAYAVAKRQCAVHARREREKRSCAVNATHPSTEASAAIILIVDNQQVKCCVTRHMPTRRAGKRQSGRGVETQRSRSGARSAYTGARAWYTRAPEPAAASARAAMSRKINYALTGLSTQNAAGAQAKDHQATAAARAQRARERRNTQPVMSLCRSTQLRSGNAKEK